MRIGIDVDLTTLKSDEAWWNWLWFMSGKDPTANEQERLGAFYDLHSANSSVSYDLSDYFPDMVNTNVHPMDFWRNEGVYDTIQPRRDAYEMIHKLIKNGEDELIFVTHNKGNGSRSKYNLLARLFGRENFSYVVTREKYNVRMDLMIDDRHDFLNRLVEKNYLIEPVCLITNYAQSEPLVDSINAFYDWYDIYEFIQQFRQELECPF